MGYKLLVILVTIGKELFPLPDLLLIYKYLDKLMNLSKLYLVKELEAFCKIEVSQVILFVIIGLNSS